jgi:hypothetical protein
MSRTFAEIERVNRIYKWFKALLTFGFGALVMHILNRCAG